MAAIEFICSQHLGVSATEAGLSVIDRRWGYCPADAHEGHRWARIAPTDVKSIELKRAAEQRREI